MASATVAVEQSSREGIWLSHVTSSLKKEERVDREIMASVFSVPKSLKCDKPEAYTPQLIALGPYHHWTPELLDMEEHKISNARIIQNHLKTGTFEELVDEIWEQHYDEVCAHYHRYLDYRNEETLSWMITIDASFLLGLLHIYVGEHGLFLSEDVSRISYLMDKDGQKSTHNMILRDVMMLENQIPLFMLRKILLECSSNELEAEIVLSIMLAGIMQEIYPFSKTKELKTSTQDTENPPHLLALLYCLIPFPDPSENEENKKPSVTRRLVSALTFRLSTRKLFSKYFKPPKPEETGLLEDCDPEGGIQQPPASHVGNILWRNVGSEVVPLQFKPTLNALVNVLKILKKNDSSPSKQQNQEIDIPSVTELIKSGVKFIRTDGGLDSIMFDKKSGNFYLPAIKLDANSDVILRNLVAYEASVARGPLTFARYSELMNGIVDTEEDVKILREANIIYGIKSNKEITKLWNGMSRSVRVTKVPILDTVISDVNAYYGGKLRVRARKFMKRKIIGTWQFLVSVAAIFLLLLTFLQAFCSFYDCKKWNTHLIAQPGNEGLLVV